MINISFFQNSQKQNSKNEAPIFMTLTYNGHRIRKAVKGAKVKISDWNSIRCRVRKKSTNSNGITSDLINAKLEELEENIRKINKVVLRENIRLSDEYILSKLEHPESIDV
ncbi:hypothetical protein, partial [Fulvivirga aurantia]|uniref:hypothetical protein n=1 Tax=Fulvivirga aurantia TaxID=2529383 RepID=UPI0012BCD635